MSDDFTGLIGEEDAQAFPAGTAIFDAGDDADCMYVVKAGTIRIMYGNRLLERVGAGGIFGEMALTDRMPRSAAAVAETDVEVVPVTQKRFLFMVQQTPFFAIQVMQVLARRLRAMNESPFGQDV